MAQHDDNVAMSRPLMLNGESYDCNDGEFEIPSLNGDLAKKVVLVVWKRYWNYTAGDLVDLLHYDGSPWSKAYVPGMNMPILESDVREYYTLFLDMIVNRIKRERQNERRRHD